MTGRRERGAFTLVEVVITLTILGILVAASVPALRGLEKEREARAPVAELVRMARTVRARAMREQQPYQIAFDYRGFHAARYFQPYGEREEFDKLVTVLEMEAREREIVEASRARGIDMSGATAEEVRRADEARRTFYETYEMPEGMTFEVLFWGETEWEEMSGARFRRWVFQPSGVCEPIKIRVRSENAFFEVAFHPLTGDVKEERSWVE